MKATPIISILVAGAALTLSGCGRPEPQRTHNPPAPFPELVEGMETPEGTDVPTGTPPENISRNPPAPLQTWTAATKDRDLGGTNPPAPILIVTPEGACYVDWVSPFMGDGPQYQSRVRTDCDTATCGTPILCPEPRAQGLLDAVSAKDADSE